MHQLFRIRLISRDRATAIVSDEAGAWYSLEITADEALELRAGELIILSEERVKALTPIRVLN